MKKQKKKRRKEKVDRPKEAEQWEIACTEMNALFNVSRNVFGVFRPQFGLMQRQFDAVLQSHQSLVTIVRCQKHRVVGIRG